MITWRLHRRRILLIAITAIACAAVAFFLLTRNTPPSRVSPAEALAIAESYVAHEWTPSDANIFHGPDADGIHVDTLDASFQPNGKEERGWWIPARQNIGIPYKWGGFDTPDEFDRGLRAGQYAGDAYSAEKRRLLDAAVSAHAVGVDCSGFVSRCWRLPRSYSTRELPELCRPVRDLADLRAGDIFNRHNAHVRLFAGWADSARTRVRVYEAKARVQMSEIALQSIIAEGYSAWRYRGMRE